MSNAHLELIGQENLPTSGGVLILPNRLNFQALLELEKLLGNRKVLYLIERNLGYNPLLQAHLEKEDVDALEFTADNTQTEAFKRELHRAIAAGEVVVFIPGDVCARPGQNMCVPVDVTSFLVESGAPILPLFMENPADTVLSIENIRDTERVVLVFGKVLEREAANMSNYLEGMLEAGEQSFSTRPVLKMHLAYALLLGLKKHGNAGVLDGTDGSFTTYGKVLAAAIVLAKHIKSQTNKERVGIILPPSKGGLIANLAVLFAGKVPVNLNFTAGEKAAKSCMQQANLDCYITADPFVRKMQRFPWPPNKQLVLIERFFPKNKAKIALWLGISKLLGSGALATVLGIPKKTTSKEAILLFTSGSSGDPKGVVLSHRNMLANVNQFGSRLDLHANDKILGCLPLFHSFGCTVTLWYPIIEGITLVTYPSPLDTPKLAELIEKCAINLVIATPTFLRGYLRKASAEQFKTVKLVVTGAEKLPQKIAETFESKFGIPVYEGYGLTETAPVTNVNLPDMSQSEGEEHHPIIPNTRLGSVGQSLPGIAVRITDPNTDEPLPLMQSGMIWLRGANIFEGYLGQPEKTEEVIRNGWFRTGDIGRVDSEGFLYIEGRLSRFSKIGGEMVPHETVEEAINAALENETDSERKVAVVGVPDDAKGEALVLLSSVRVDSTDLRYKLLDRGIPSLWIPKQVVDVNEIPLLASGKLDIKRCEEIARS